MIFFIKSYKPQDQRSTFGPNSKPLTTCFQLLLCDCEKGICLKSMDTTLTFKVRNPFNFCLKYSNGGHLKNHLHAYARPKHYISRLNGVTVISRIKKRKQCCKL